jgi:hypothetical protein
MNRKMHQSLQVAHQQIKIEQERSEKLLLNILPGSIADRLRNSDKTIADGFADVTVMFADIVNFTQVAANMSPSQVFAMLNRIFSAFDELAEHYGLEKIKTIGDAYMVAGGLNEDLSDYSAAVADMAIAMRDLLRRISRSTPRTLKCASASAPADRRRRARQEEIHLRPVGRHGQYRQPHHVGRRAGHDPVRHHDLPPPGGQLRLPRATDHLPQGQGQHDGVSPDRPQGRRKLRRNPGGARRRPPSGTGLRQAEADPAGAVLHQFEAVSGGLGMARGLVKPDAVTAFR